jgi:hypothetical protein
MLTCKEASKMVSQSMDRRLSVPERIGVRFHLLICKGCAQFRDHMTLLRRTCSQHAGSEESESALPGLSPAARDRIRQALMHNDG